MTPVAWGLYNPATDKLDHRCYQREETARIGAANLTNKWRTIVAVPLLLSYAADPLINALTLTERNLTSLINAQHHDALLMTPWREEVRRAILAVEPDWKPS